MQALITVTRRTVYTSIVEMSEDTYKRLDTALNGGRVETSQAQKELNRLIDTADWQDDELHTLDEFRRFEEGK